jgi:sulfatase modifying factor 1
MTGNILIFLCLLNTEVTMSGKNARIRISFLLLIFIFIGKSPVSAVDVALLDGTTIVGVVQGIVNIKTSFGPIGVNGQSIIALNFGDNARIELVDGSVLIGVLLDKTLSIKLSYGTALLDVSKIKSIGQKALSVTVSNANPVSQDAARIQITTIGGIEFVTVPEGRFNMGDSSSSGEYDERPVHKVFIDSFRLSRREITLKQYRSYVLEASPKTQGQWKGNGEEHPVVGISWEDATAFCIWFGKKYGIATRLPTEAEWEYAARGGLEGMTFPNGDTLSENEANFQSAGTRNGGTYPQNGFGFFDMAGNVWEWCLDWYDGKYYDSSSDRNPQGPASGNYRTLRGGGWNGSASNSRVANRSYNSPTISNNQLGFRICLPIY